MARFFTMEGNMKRYDSRRVAKAMASGMIKRAEELRQKPKLTPDERKELRRFREIAGLVLSLGV